MFASWRLAGPELGTGGVAGLKEVPPVAVEVFEDGDGAVGFLAGRLEEFDVGGLHEAIVSPEIVGVEKEEDPATCLVADLKDLRGVSGLRKQQTRSARAWWSNNEPAFTERERRIFHDAEAQAFGEEDQGLVVIADKESDMSEQLRHGN